MKKRFCLRALTALLCLVMLMSVGLLHIHAADGEPADFSTQNIAAYSTLSNSFDELNVFYIDKGKAEARVAAADQVTKIIGEYLGHAKEYRFNTDLLTQEDLSPVFDLIQKKGELAARLTWIAYAHDVISLDADGNPTDTATNLPYMTLSNRLKDVGNITDIGTITETYEHSLCTEINRSVFHHKVNALPAAYGVPEVNVKSALDEAIAAINACDGYDEETADPSISKDDYLLDGIEFEAIYDVAEAAVILERHRLDAEAEYGEVYDLLGLPDAERRNALADLALLLDDDASTVAVNETLKNAVGALLDRALPDNGKKYVPAYRDALTAAFGAAATAAGEDRTADLSPYLDGSDPTACAYAFSKYAPCAIAKDLVFEESSDATVLRIIDEYVKPNGILEKCASQEELDFEVARATLRKEFYRDYRDSASQLEATAPAAKRGELLTSLLSLYTEADADVTEITFYHNQPLPSCQAIVDAAKQDMEDVLRTAEAYRFISNHETVLNDDTITTDGDDRDRLNAAIADFSALHKDTQKKLDELGDTRKKINDKYKALTVLDIKNGNGSTDYATADQVTALRQEALDKLCALVNAPDSATAEPQSTKQISDDAVRRADEVLSLLQAYDEVLDAEHYGQYAKEDKDLLRADATDALATLTDPKASPNAAVVPAAKLDMARHAAIAEVRLAVGDSTLPNVAEAFRKAAEDIGKATDTATILTIRDAAIFRIGARIRGGEMRDKVAEAEQQIADLPALSKEEKDAILSSPEMEALKKACADAEEAENAAALENIASDFEKKRTALLENARRRSLEAAVDQAIDLVEQKSEEATDALKSLTYITDKNRDTFQKRIADLLTAFRADAEAATDYDTLTDKRDLTLGRIAETRAEAEAAEQEACREAVSRDWGDAFEQPDHYSDEHYATVQEILRESREALTGKTTVSDMLTLQEETVRRLRAVPTVLDEAKEEAARRIEEVYQDLMKNDTCYSDEALENLQSIRDHALAEVHQTQQISDAENVLKIATEKCELMENVRRDILYTEGYDDTPPAAYPDDHDPEADGLWGSLYAPDRIPHDSRFTATLFDAKDKQSDYEKAVRQKLLLTSDGEPADEALLSKLRDSLLLSGIELTYTATHEGPYLITLLLPADMDPADVLGVLYLKDDGSAEFYRCEIDGSLITFEIPHFSAFYIVAQKPIDLWIFIILLSLILLAELVAIAILLLRRSKREATLPMMALLPFSPVTALRRILPAGGVITLVILGILVVAATVVLTWLIVDEREYRRAHQKRPVAEAAVPEPEPVSNPELEPEPEPEPLPVVTVAEADELISDREAEAKIETREIPLRHPIGKKTEINIDVISAHFAEGDTVSLESLKEKGLIPKSAQAIKILARGALDKPLTVLAHDFSVAAVKMILLTGGEAILIERAKTSD